MIRVITGQLGSGKTYYAVNYLRQFVKYDKLYNTMVIDTDLLVVTNIDGVSINHMSFDDFLKQGLLNIETFREFKEKFNYKHTILIIDEAQKYFDKSTTTEQFFFFEYCRHLGIDVFLITQSLAALPKRLCMLSEYIVDAMPRTYSIGGFRYQLKDVSKGFVIQQIMIKKDQVTFRLYKSFEIDEHAKAKPQHYVLRKYIIGIIIVVISLGSAITFLKNGFSFKKPSSQEQTEPQIKTFQKQPTITAPPTVQAPDPGIDLKTYPYLVVNTNLEKKPDGQTILGVAHVGENTYIFTK